MTKLSLYYPVSPYHLNQEFGENPEYYARFHDAFGNPEKGHNGNDLMAFHGQPVYAAQDGIAQSAKDDHGGEGIYITTQDYYDYKNIQSRYRMINWHLVGDTDPKYPPPIPLDMLPHPVQAGNLIGYADNTGAPFESSGDHLHFGLIPVDQAGNAQEPANGFNGCIDPQPFFNGQFSKNAPLVIANLQKQVSILQQIVNLWTSFKVK